MILEELLKHNATVISMTVNDRIVDAALIMQQQQVGSVVVTTDQKVVGIITDRDIALALALGAATPDSTVSEVMSRDVVTIPSTATMFEAARIFRLSQVRRLPVIDRHQNLVGLISLDDMTSVLAREIFDTCSALEPAILREI